MRILFTGASSAAGGRVLQRILDSVADAEVWCARHQKELEVSDSRIRVFDWDLATDSSAELLPDAIDLVIHFAGVTHSPNAEAYWSVNHQGTMRLAEAARARGCRRFVYISTRCATPAAGAYGESKLAAENDLKKLGGNSLLIIRPAEIYGGKGREGVDKLIAVARRWHFTPWLFGNSTIAFAPLHIEDFAAVVVDEIMKPTEGLRIVELCGPEDLSPVALGTRIAKRYKALPVPVWWPLFALFLKIAAGFNLGLAVPDQLPRLISPKTSTAKSADRKGRVRFLLD